MRKIEEKMITAIQNKKNWSKDNTSVSVIIYSPEDTVILKQITHITVRLHSHEILNIINKQLLLSDAGYQTKTTKSRLNAILSLYDLGKIYSKDYQWYLNDEEWTGSKEFEMDS